MNGLETALMFKTICYATNDGRKMRNSAIHSFQKERKVKPINGPEYKNKCRKIEHEC